MSRSGVATSLRKSVQVSAMIVTLSRLYDDGVHARAVVDELKAAGLPADDIGIIGSSRCTARTNAALERDAEDDHGHTVNRSAGIAGAALGRAAGLLAGLGAFVLPGIGGVGVAAGWLCEAPWRARWPAAPPAAWWAR